ncbi:MAG: HAMP domain-containing histidine kinase [Eubacterium sp.]|nr:HAMP domain-containing histidine kinase [Eubacterium sp.]
MKEFANKLIEKIKNIKIDGITRRWLINIIGVIAALFIIAFVFLSVTVKNYYYHSVENIVSSGASDTAVSYFKNNIENGNSLEESAAQYVDSYNLKKTTTIWIIDDIGKVILSSSGFEVEDAYMPDFEDAMHNESGEAKFIGRVRGSGKIIAKTKAIKDKNGAEIGAIRVMSNIDEVDDQISTIKFLIFLIFLFVMVIIVFSNLFFIRSIIIPVSQINKATKLIASGNLDVRIEKKYNDEIGDLADSINSMAGDIAAADKMKNDFISTISHELRTPLTSIKGWGETLTLGNQDNVDPLTRKGLQIIVSEAGRLEGFVEELLDFSRLQSGRMNLRLAKCDIIAELEETLFTFRERAVREGYEVKYSVPENPSVANADSNRLKQVFMNILDNALKYSRPGSRILVKADYITKQDKPFVRIAIADQGCGISPEDLPHVKEKFYKANMSVRGSGIGLAVTNEIVSMHGGTLDIRSEVDRGTLVTIYLPLEEIGEIEKQ